MQFYARFGNYVRPANQPNSNRTWGFLGILYFQCRYCRLNLCAEYPADWFCAPLLFLPPPGKPHVNNNKYRFISHFPNGWRKTRLFFFTFCTFALYYRSSFLHDSFHTDIRLFLYIRIWWAQSTKRALYLLKVLYERRHHHYNRTSSLSPIKNEVLNHNFSQLNIDFWGILATSLEFQNFLYFF